MKLNKQNLIKNSAKREAAIERASKINFMREILTSIKNASDKGRLETCVEYCRGTNPKDYIPLLEKRGFQTRVVEDTGRIHPERRFYIFWGSDV